MLWRSISRGACSIWIPIYKRFCWSANVCQASGVNRSTAPVRSLVSRTATASPDLAHFDALAAVAAEAGLAPVPA